MFIRNNQTLSSLEDENSCIRSTRYNAPIDLMIRDIESRFTFVRASESVLSVPWRLVSIFLPLFYFRISFSSLPFVPFLFVVAPFSRYPTKSVVRV